MPSSLPRMEHLVLALILKTSIMLSLLLRQNRELEISKVLDEYLEKVLNKVKAILYDIADDCTKNQRRNYTLNHFIERIKIYNEENFNYEIITIQLKRKIKLCQ